LKSWKTFIESFKDIRKGQYDIPLIRYTLELRLVLWVRLDPQAGCEDELPDGRAEAGEKGVEGLNRRNMD
jgi:hypothetical protein